MKYKNILITGGCGFVGSNLAEKIKKDCLNTKVTVLDNLHRSGSELNAARLQKIGIKFIKGDVRKRKDWDLERHIDLVIECAAEPSVMAGTGTNSQYVVDTNLVGTLNCLEFARTNKSALIFISTSRVYPIHELRAIPLLELKSRFEIDKERPFPGVSEYGVSELFPLGDFRTLYGATKLASEFIIKEYSKNYEIPSVIDRCGVIAGPWQFGKVDQGIISFWVAQHFFRSKKLSYTGFGGNGKQVRDCLHIDDLYEVLKIQFDCLDSLRGDIFNIGGGKDCSVSLCELTELCREISGYSIEIDHDSNDRPGDIPLYLSDSRRFSSLTGWKPCFDSRKIVKDVFGWMKENEKKLYRIFAKM